MLIMWGAACSWLAGLDSREVTQRWVASVTQEVWENTALMKTVSWEATPLVRGGKDINSFWNEVCQMDYVIWHPWEADHSYTTGSMKVPDDYCMVSSATFPQVHTQVEWYSNKQLNDRTCSVFQMLCGSRDNDWKKGHFFGLSINLRASTNISN